MIEVFLTELQEPQNYNIMVSYITSEIWLRLRKTNSYIAILPQRQIIYIRCSNLPTTEKIVEGTGIIAIAQDCQIKTNSILIQGYNVYHSEIYPEIRPFVSPIFDFNNTWDEINSFHRGDIKHLDIPRHRIRGIA